MLSQCQAAHAHPLRPFAPRQTLYLTYTCPKPAQNYARWHDRFFGAKTRIQQLFCAQFRCSMFFGSLDPKNVIISDHRNQKQILRTWRAHLSIPPRRQCICRIFRSGQDPHQPRAPSTKLTLLVLLYLSNTHKTVVLSRAVEAWRRSGAVWVDVHRSKGIRSYKAEGLGS